MPNPLSRAIDLLRSARAILIFTGAGVSTDSGIPDFRGPDGLWNRIDPAEFSYERYISNAETRRRSWAMRGAELFGALPNPAHYAITDLWRSERMAGCVTQNIDGLHQAAGLPGELVVELHGSARTARCLACGSSWPTAEIWERVRKGDSDPHCACGGIIKVAVVSFGEPLPVGEMDRAERLAGRCDAVVAAGSTLSVYPAAYVPLAAHERGVPYVILNRGPTDQDAVADIRIDGPVGESLPAIAAALRKRSARPRAASPGNHTRDRPMRPPDRTA